VDLKAVRAGIADALRTVSPRLNAYPATPGAVSVPCVLVVLQRKSFDMAHGRGADEVRVTLRLLVSRADDEAGQDRLDAYLAGSGPSSIKGAMEAARGAPGAGALNGVCDDVQVTGWDNYGMHEHAGVMFLGAEFDVRVIGDGS
jgi:hypothetical protein